MLDLMSSKGTREILEYIRNQSEPVSSTNINKYFSKESRSASLTTATIYRRLKELELAGFIIRKPPDSNNFTLTQQAKNIFEIQILKHPEITELKRSQRALLREIKEREVVNVVELQEEARMSPTTINIGIQKLSKLGLIEQVNNGEAQKNLLEKSVQKKMKKIQKKRPGRPKKRHRLTKKGKDVYKKQKQLEEDQLK